MNRRGFFGTLAAIAGAAKAAPAVKDVSSSPMPCEWTARAGGAWDRVMNRDAAAIEWLRDKCFKDELVEVDSLLQILKGTSARLEWTNTTNTPYFLAIDSGSGPWREYVSILQSRESLIAFPGFVQWEFRITSVGESGCYVRSCDMISQPS
jgi:hypothetical protein